MVITGPVETYHVYMSYNREERVCSLCIMMHQYNDGHDPMGLF